MRASLALLCALLAPLATHAREQVLHTERSLYRNIAVVENEGVRCLKFTLKRQDSRQSCIDVADPTNLVLPYLPVAFAGLTVNPDPDSVLILGLGGGTLTEIFATLFPGIRIDAVEIDEAVVRVAREFFDYAEKPGTETHVRDGRVFVRRAARAGKRYDYIILDAFNGDYIPEHLMTREFLEEVRDLLSADGVLVANTFSSSRLYDSESATYASVFGEFLNLRRRYGNRVIVAAGHGDLPPPATLRDNARAVAADLDRYGIDLEQILTLDRGRDWRARARVLTDQYAPANLLRGARGR